jgi:hypothetical protein
MSELRTRSGQWKRLIRSLACPIITPELWFCTSGVYLWWGVCIPSLHSSESGTNIEYTWAFLYALVIQWSLGERKYESYMYISFYVFCLIFIFNWIVFVSVLSDLHLPRHVHATSPLSTRIADNIEPVNNVQIVGYFYAVSHKVMHFYKFQIRVKHLWITEEFNNIVYGTLFDV